jgi:hypothetical protein
VAAPALGAAGLSAEERVAALVLEAGLSALERVAALVLEAGLSAVERAAAPALGAAGLSALERMAAPVLEAGLSAGKAAAPALGAGLSALERAAAPAFGAELSAGKAAAPVLEAGLSAVERAAAPAFGAGLSAAGPDPEQALVSGPAGVFPLWRLPVRSRFQHRPTVFPIHPCSWTAPPCRCPREGPDALRPSPARAVVRPVEEGIRVRAAEPVQMPGKRGGFPREAAGRAGGDGPVRAAGERIRVRAAG